MNIHHPPSWVRRYYKNTIWHMPNQGKVLYLTFDDGPTPEITEWVLNTLDKYDAKATFFCIGRNADRYPEIVAEAQGRGHSVGNHTYSHLKGWKVNKVEYLQDVEMADELLNTRLFRPPYGRIKKKQLRAVQKVGYSIYMWDVLSEDYNKNISPEQCLANVSKYARPGSIIVFHDSAKAYPNLKHALPQVLKKYKDLGFSFCSLK